jgi:hypothetical protein
MSIRSNHAFIMVAVVALGCALPSSLEAQDTVRATPRDSTKAHTLAPMTVSGRIDNLVGVATSASEGHIGAADLRLRPITREGELLEAVPGLIVTQHSGEGKANQYFVRGFNLDHGTDFQTQVDGMPINMPTHGHGQGYTDLNFLIPELVDNIDYKLGVYHADLGDFGSAGGAEFHLVQSVAKPFVTVESGANGLARVAVASSSEVGGGSLLFGGEAKSYNGPWLRPEDVQKFSGLSRYSWQSGASQFSMLAMAYHNKWNSNDQIPDRAVSEGLISRFGQIDSTDGGQSDRYSVSGSWKRLTSSGLDEVQIYGVRSDLSLYSDFTYFLDNPTRGDQFNQTDHRTIIGGSASRAQFVDLFGVTHSLKFGVQTRGDIIDPVGLYHTERRVRFSTVRQDKANEIGTGVYVEAESRWTPWFRSVLGARADAYSFDVTSSLPENSGKRTASIASPKMSFVLTPSSETEIYLSAGYGFHSNDARGTTITVDPSTGDSASRVDPLVRSRGAELGFRATLPGGVRSTVSLWALNLDSELLFTGDAGTTEPSAESHRHGVTFANFYRPTKYLALDADVSFANAKFVGVEAGQTHIPGALESVVAGGVTWMPTPNGVFGSVRLRHFGSYAPIEDNSVRAHPSTLASAEVGYQLVSGTRLQVSLLNALNGRAEDIQYFYASRLPGEPAGGVDGVHSHPAEPRQVRVSLEHDFR